MQSNQVLIREAIKEEDSLIANHFYQLWRDNEVSANLIRDNWLDLTLEFIDRARQELSFQAFVAEVDSIIVGSTSCQLFAGLYPLILEDGYRKYGYIWNVYVEKSYRRRQIAKKLMQAAQNYLKYLECTTFILHASPLGKPVYDRLGFKGSNEMRLDSSDTV